MSRLRRGELVARVLAGSWRDPAPTTDVTSNELAQVVPLLVATGAAGLAWRTSRSRGDLGAAAEHLHDSWLLEVGRDRRREVLVAELAHAARRSGIELVVFKGWATARFYPGPGLRPSGDVDVLVAAEDLAGAEALERRVPGLALDVHASPPAGLRAFEDVLDRAERRPADGESVAVPCVEHELRIAAWHLIKHGGWRPVWLCDVAALLEAVGEVALPADEPYRNYAMSAAALASALLGAQTAVEEAPPRWAGRTVLTEWGHLRQRAYGLLSTSLARSPRSALAEVSGRLPNRLAAAAALDQQLADTRPAITGVTAVVRRLRTMRTRLRSGVLSQE